VLAAVLAAATAALNGYLALVTAVAGLRRRRPVGSSGEPKHRIAVLVPAHDEERIIGPTITSLVGQSYPRDLFGVHVVADNCTDATADVARRHGATVHERFDADAPGKGPALGWLMEQLGDQPDAVVIVDADTTMAPSFLRVVDAALDGDLSAWQGYYTVHEPEQATSTALRHAALLLRHYVRPLGRTGLGASCGLFGNGMVFRTDLLRRRRFTAHLTEDVEFQLELLLDGELVGFLPDAVVEAEMPTTLEGARTQNERWERGRLQLARRYVPELARRAVHPATGQRVATVDAILDQLVPPLSVLAAGTTVVASAATVLRSRTAARLGWFALAALAFHVVAGLGVARAPRAVYAALLRAPRLVGWKVVLWVRMLARRGDVAWTRTARNI
jgi:hypothetical protein